MKKVPSEIVLGDTDDEDGPSASQKTEVEDEGAFFARLGFLG